MLTQEEYIASVEEASLKLPPKEAAEMRSETSQLLECNCPQPNINQDEVKACKELREDNSRAILTADKRVAVVVVDKQDYLKKAQDLLAGKDTYKPITEDHTSRHRNKLIQTHRAINAQGRLSDSTNKRLFPTGAVPTQILWSSQNP